LGAPEIWPATLRSAVRILLTSRHPMFIWWGPELIQFYNDAYRQTMGPERHPSALGQRGRECWDEIWDIIGPQIDLVMEGRGATWHEDQLVPVTRFGSRQDVWWTYGYSPIDDGVGGVGGVLVVCNDVTQQHLSNERLRSLFQQAPGFVAILAEPDHVFEHINEAYSELVGRRDVVGRPVREALPEVVGQGFIAVLDTVVTSGKAFVASDLSVVLQDEAGNMRERHLDFVYQPTFDASGAVTGIFVQGYDVTAQVAAARQREILTGELEHRVRNTLAMVTAIIDQTFRSTETKEAAHDVLKGRVVALAHAHDILSRTNWRDAAITDVVKAALAPHQTPENRIRLSGPALPITARQSLSLSLALHELATNALKYGALSVAEGLVEVTWAGDQAGRGPGLRFRWEESGGPIVTPPTRRGFGTRLIEQMLAADFGAAVRIDYRPAGVVCELTLVD
ncbi:MAG: PAS domain-containing protein, partial [Bauldia sp.]|nr:PAS domain-containing protein [Bauldia sp.]